LRRAPAHLTATLLALVLAGAVARADHVPREGASMVGAPAPELRGLAWLQGGPLTLEALRGKVVLIRFFTGGCPYCSATAPALRALDAAHRADGLVTLGIHHPKAKDGPDPRETVRALGFTFPVATDPRWETVRAWGVGTTFRRFTSLTFLVDRRGIIRFVHDGGEWHDGGGAGHEACQAAHDALVATLERLLATP
jgi:peroxiredoxin